METVIPVKFSNLEGIQQRVLEYFPINMSNVGNSLFYINDNVSKFLSIKDLKTNLDSLGLTEYISFIGFYIVHTTSENGSTKHIDSGGYNYSLNIPICGCYNTFVNFYNTNTVPTLKQTRLGVSYYEYDQSISDIIGSLELTTPHIINVKVPHNIVNKNSMPRITLLVRLSTKWNGKILNQN